MSALPGGAARRAWVIALLLLVVASTLVAAGGGHGHGEEEEIDEHELEEACAKEEIEEYNLGLHIGAVFILLGVSLAGSFLPVLMSYFTHPYFIIAIRLGMFFGFGTILSTAFIHMLMPANAYLSSPCLTGTWRNYEAWAFMFCVAAIAGIQLVDYMIEVVCDHGKNCDSGCTHRSTVGHGTGSPAAVADAQLDRGVSNVQLATSKSAVGFLSKAQEVGSSSDGGCSATCCATPRELQGMQVMGGTVQVDEEAGARYVTEVARDDLELVGHHFLTDVPADLSQRAGFYMVEAGIVFHSVLIGLTLGVTSGSTFTTLLIALSFHQFFEGLAIGAAALGTGLSRCKSFLVGLVYSLTTPTGIAIGIAVRHSWNGNATTTLIAQGVLDSLSAGVLIYVVLVELITPMLTKSHWMRKQAWYVQLTGLLCFWSGAAVMAVIGTWA